MKQLRFAGGADIYVKRYQQFMGVDFSTDPLLVDDARSPWAPNLISDTGQMPEKRLGYREVASYDGAICGIFHCVINGVQHLLVHAGEKIYDGETELISGVNNARSSSFYHGGRLYIYTGAEFLVFDGETLEAVEGKIPTIVIGRSPTSGGGTFLEAINLIQPKWTESFLGESAVRAYQLSYAGLDETAVTARTMTAGGDWVDLVENADFTVDRTTGVVTFNTAPGASPITGADNVEITASKERDGSPVTHALGAVVFGDYIFCCGSVKGTDYRSGFGDPTYWPDTGYDEVGTDETDIMGYLHIGRYLAVVKEDNDQDSTVFLRYETTAAGEPAFAREPAIVSIGAISRHAFGNLRGEPLFLSRQGVFAVTSNIVTSEKMVQNRSYFVDLNLTKEDLKNAVAVEWDGYFIVCTAPRCYVLDGRQNKTYRKQSSDYLYECYHWDNIPATCFCGFDGELYFGTSDGKVMKFNTDIAGMTRYSDAGVAIASSWSTKADDDGDFTRRKALASSGVGILIKPYTHSSAEVLIESESDFGFVAASRRMDLFDFSDLDFTRFSFMTADKPQVIPVRYRKRYNTIQFTVRNTQNNEGFGVYGIIKRYCFAGYVR